LTTEGEGQKQAQRVENIKKRKENESDKRRKYDRGRQHGASSGI